MISELYEFVRFLGPLASNYSEAELIRLYAEMHQMAELLLDIYRCNSSGGQVDSEED